MEIKVNDNVLVLTGKYKGKQGKVLATFPKNNTVVVEGVAIVHKCGKATRVGHTVVEGKRVRVCKKCGAVLDKAYAKKAKKAAPAEVKEEAPKKRTRKRSQKSEEANKEAPVE